MKRAPALALAVLLAACGNTPSSVPVEPTSSIASAPSAVASAPSAVASAAAAEAPVPFADLVASLSEPDGPFFSDNTISNETSYLQVSSLLAKTTAPGGAYIGVGPEQNFTYIAETRPKIAFIVDIRRQNLVEHLLYKAIFDEATSRAHFVALLLGRPFDAASDPGPGAPLSAVLAAAERRPADEASFKEIHARLRDRVERAARIDAADRRSLEVTHRSFFKGQLEIRFELKEKNGRVYPTLRELFSQKDPAGKQRGFLATEDAFRFVQGLEKAGRVVPVVGDFAGKKALPGIAAYLKQNKLVVSAFYTSNVEQYLFEPGVWSRWAANVAALPTDEKSVFVRAYLDQGKRHPQQMQGHRTATVLQRVRDFDERQQRTPFASFWAVSTEKVLGEDGAVL